ncbi:MAG: DUF4350 domain-containing protein [Ignisphaera sp.]|uniref:DUF4350 domain-containing protein n=1 Tax=Ignisphaera aggregans TaxID=334771 RepID=A0A7C4JKK3_9CREN
MAKASSALFILIILVALIMLSQSATVVWRTLEKDPPSVFNYGPGGVSYFYADAIIRAGDVNVIYDLSELRSYNPQKYVLILLSPDIPLSDKEVDSVLSWVEIGGTAIVGDEVNTTFLLTSKLGFQQTYRLPALLTSQCYLANGSIIEVLLNVFVIYAPVNASVPFQPICVNEYGPMVYNIVYGRGRIYLMGDSSVVINEIFVKAPASFNNNTAFVYGLVGDKSIVVYEGSRIYGYAELRALSTGFTLLFSFIGMVFSNIMNLGLVPRTIFLLVLTLLSTALVMAKFGTPRSLRKIFKSEQKGVDEKKMFDLSKLLKDISLGVKTWVESMKTK